MTNDQTSSRVAGVPRVAVLMATYNGGKHIREQIDSILAQSGVEVVLFVRDDHSSDDTVRIVSGYMDLYPNVFLLENLQGQLRVTKNFYSIVRDIDISGIDYICYADQDDIWLPEKLSSAIRVIHSMQVDCYASNLIMGDADGNIITHTSPLRRLMRYLMNRKSNRQTEFDHYLEAASAGCTLVLNRRSALYFQERIRKIYDALPSDASHDWSTYAITRLKGFKWLIDNHSYIIYRQHSENAYGGNIGTGGVSKLIALFRSGWYRKHILMIEDLYNEGDIHPPFIEQVRHFNKASFFSRWRVAMAISRYRRKWFHRILLFMLVLLGYFK